MFVNFGELKRKKEKRAVVLVLCFGVLVHDHEEGGRPILDDQT